MNTSASRRINCDSKFLKTASGDARVNPALTRLSMWETRWEERQVFVCKS